MKLIKDFFPEIKKYYHITENGQVFSSWGKGRILSPKRKENGYLEYGLVKEDGSLKHLTGHVLVATCFLEKTESSECVNHINGDKTDNRVLNLEWSSQKENIAHAWETGLTKARKGDSSNLSSISEEQAKEVVALLESRQYSDKEIHEITGLSIRGIISRIRRRETWKHLTNNDKILGKSQKRK